MSKDVTEFPTLDWIRKLPDWVSAKFNAEHNVIVLVGERNNVIKHVSWPLGDATEEKAVIALRNLGGSFFELAQPGEFERLIKCRAERARDEKMLDPIDQMLWNELNMMQQFAA